MMRGADTLLAMRRRGYAPRNGVSITLHADRIPPEIPHGVDPASTVCIDIAGDERLDRLDLRCLVGLRVAISGPCDDRVRSAVEAAAAAGAAGVIGIEHKATDGEVFERWIVAHKPWTSPVNPWQA